MSTAEFTAGEHVLWCSREVIVDAARYKHYVTLAIPDGWVYDIRDPVTGKILLFAANARELTRMP